MLRVYLRDLCLLALLALLVMQSAGHAAEITLRMKGGDFEIKGELRSFDRKKYVVDTKAFGPLTAEATRFDCVAGPCPLTTVSPPVAPMIRDGVDLGTTTWVGGSVIGTEFVPRLIHSFARTVKATVTGSVGSDPRDLEFRLTGASGRPMGKVNVMRQGIPAGFAALEQKKADVVMAGRPITPEEAQRLAAAGIGPMQGPTSEHIFALDAIVVLVSRDNPAVSASIDTIANIFAGKITDWSEIGLPPGPINVYAPTQELGTWNQFDTLVMKPRGLQLTPKAVRLQHTNDWTDRVVADPNGISINTIAAIRGAKALNIEGSCGLVIRPTVFTTKTEEYPLTRRLFLYTAGEPRHPLARALVSYAMSSGVQEVLKEAGLVDHEADTQGFDEQGSRIAHALNAPAEDFDQALMRQLIEEMRVSRRSSITLRFDPLSVTLDSRSNQLVSYLRSLLLTPEMKGRTVVMVGFSDSFGKFQSNLVLAQNRAAAARAALLADGPLPGITVVERAYGELAPVACNDNEATRALNRRVEVWLR